MSKNRKTLAVALLLFGSALILLSFFSNLQHWSGAVYCSLAFAGFLFATTALLLVMFGKRA